MNVSSRYGKDIKLYRAYRRQTSQDAGSLLKKASGGIPSAGDLIFHRIETVAQIGASGIFHQPPPPDRIAEGTGKGPRGKGVDRSVVPEGSLRAASALPLLLSLDRFFFSDDDGHYSMHDGGAEDGIRIRNQKGNLLGCDG